MDIKVHRKSVVAFDLDDTLYKEIDFVRSAFKSIARKIDTENWVNTYSDMFLTFRNDKDVFERLTSNHGGSKEELIRCYRNHIPDISLCENARFLIKQIKSNGGIIGVITDGRISTQNNKINQLGLSGLLDFLYISEETGFDKHHSHNFRLLQKKYPEFEYTYIADNPKKDFYHPNNLGWNTIGILDNGSHIHKQELHKITREYLPENWISELKDLIVK